MAESKNNFIKAKMNQDLDDRLIPQGEYRVGQNVTISRSEGDGVGTFQNILGNNDLSSFGLTDVNLKNVQSIKINASGNNQEYFLHLRTKGTLLPWQYYQLGFKVQKNFQTYNLPIADFKRSSFFISKNRPKSAI